MTAAAATLCRDEQLDRMAGFIRNDHMLVGVHISLDARNGQVFATLSVAFKFSLDKAQGSTSCAPIAGQNAYGTKTGHPISEAHSLQWYSNIV